MNIYEAIEKLKQKDYEKRGGAIEINGYSEYSPQIIIDVFKDRVYLNYNWMYDDHESYGMAEETDIILSELNIETEEAKKIIKENTDIRVIVINDVGSISCEQDYNPEHMERFTEYQVLFLEKNKNIAKIGHYLDEYDKNEDKKYLECIKVEYLKDFKEKNISFDDSIFMKTGGYYSTKETLSNEELKEYKDLAEKYENKCNGTQEKTAETEEEKEELGVMDSLDDIKKNEMKEPEQKAPGGNSREARS